MRYDFFLNKTAPPATVNKHLTPDARRDAAFSKSLKTRPQFMVTVLEEAMTRTRHLRITVPSCSRPRCLPVGLLLGMLVLGVGCTTGHSSDVEGPGPTAAGAAGAAEPQARAGWVPA